jgi:multiple sugar transport system permease protein
MIQKKWKDYCWGYFFIAPTIIGLMVLNIWPIIKTLMLSFSNDLGFGKFKIVGIENYQKLASDPKLVTSIGNTLVFAFVSVPVGILIAIVLANLMSQKIRGVQFYRVLYFLPMIAAPAAVTMVWRMIFNRQYGLVNGVLSNFGIDGPGWISTPGYAMGTIIIIAIWSSIGNQIIILVAAMSGIESSYYEAAAIDGANQFQALTKITLPLVSPSIFFLTITGVINALRQFDVIYMMYHQTNNPALDSVRTLMYTYYQQAFVANDKAYASAIVMVAFIIIMVFTGIQFVAQRKWVHYE